MIIADTSIWIEFLRGNPEIAPLMRSLLEDGRILALEPVFGELLQGARDEKERRLILEYWEALPKASESGLWIQAGRISSESGWTSKGLGLIDAVLVVAARSFSARLWTLDKKILRAIPPRDIYRVSE
jgi:predicted nucleic acid-binding protein